MGKLPLKVQLIQQRMQVTNREMKRLQMKRTETNLRCRNNFLMTSYMIKRVFFSVLFYCALQSVSAQKGLIQKAYNYYKEPYQQYDEAKKAIDEAMLSDENKTNEKAWYYRGL